MERDEITFKIGDYSKTGGQGGILFEVATSIYIDSDGNRKMEEKTGNNKNLQSKKII